MIRLAASLAAFAAAAACATHQEPALPETPPPVAEADAKPEPTPATAELVDPHLWLEEVEGEEALAWVRGQNERSLAALRADPRHAGFEAAAIEVATSDARIPYGVIRDGLVYNFWQDETNVRGLWRRTPLESYASEDPDWETVLDLDALAEAEGANWVYKGANCYQSAPGERWVCLLSLSDGGKDAVIQREFDLQTKSFVEGGFETPEAKQGAAWVDYDTLLISTDWGGDGSTLTESGYPSIVKRWTRGAPLESAEELIRGEKTDVAAYPYTIETEDGRTLPFARVSDTFFTHSHFWLPGGEAPVQLPIPPKSSPGSVYRGRLLVSLREDWAPEGQGVAFASGDLVAFDLGAFLETKALPPVELVFSPGPRQAVNGVAVAKGAALLSIDDNVVGKILKLDLGPAGWTTQPLDLPGTGQTGIAFADKHADTAFLNYEGFLTPDSLLRYEVSTGAVTPLKGLPEEFDTAGLTVSQFEVASKDGVMVPYFLIHREDMALTGDTPTLLYGYGGFQVSLNPSYSATVGRLWLEQGGAYALANIRGGGEFGPAWHQAGLKLERQRIYDDFIAVGEDLIARGVTAPDHLGIMGGSNGGLLMGVMLNQRPDLWNAVVVQVPLLDMLRYHLLLAGASWVDEYGSPDVPEERAFLETISPYQNFDPATDYPAPFFVTSTKDDRVHPGHARKMAKRFEEAGKPFLYYENIDGGHSAAANQTARAKRSALEFTYLASRLFPAEE
ncbi:MAG: prolyl oligopeptidase family serine peptidase [Pseudomonadota bacterium]